MVQHRLFGPRREKQLGNLLGELAQQRLVRRRAQGNQVVALRIEVACPAPELEGESWPERRGAPACIEVPAGASGGPDGALHPLLQLCVECLLGRGAWLDGPQAPAGSPSRPV